MRTNQRGGGKREEKEGVEREKRNVTHLWLEITMSNAVLVQVFYSLYDLSRNDGGIFFTVFAMLDDVIEDFTALSQFHDLQRVAMMRRRGKMRRATKRQQQQQQGEVGSNHVDVFARLVDIIEVKDVWMIRNPFHDLDLAIHDLLSVLLFDNLHSNLLMCLLVLSFLHDGEASTVRINKGGERNWL